jgi:hypothetical protein
VVVLFVLLCLCCVKYFECKRLGIVWLQLNVQHVSQIYTGFKKKAGFEQ